jgi:hypothetical protein
MYMMGISSKYTCYIFVIFMCAMQCNETFIATHDQLCNSGPLFVTETNEHRC